MTYISDRKKQNDRHAGGDKLPASSLSMSNVECSN